MGKNVFRDWIYRRGIAVFDLEGGGSIDGCRIYLDVGFHPFRITHVLGARRGGQEPHNLTHEINAQCGTMFEEIPDNSDRFEFGTRKSPLEDDSVCEEAVETSVRILKYIAERRLAEIS